VLKSGTKSQKSRRCENHNADERNLNSNYITPPPKKKGNVSKLINLCEVIEYFIFKEYSKNARFTVLTGVLVTLQIIRDVKAVS
jgi:hypothetical protein